MQLFNEVFRVRQQIYQLKQKLISLEDTCKTRCSIKDSQEIEDIQDKLEHLNIRNHILECMSKKCVLF